MVSDPYKCLFILILLHHIEKEVETEEKGDYHIVCLGESCLLSAKCNIEDGGEARVSNDNDDRSVKDSLPPALLRDDEPLRLHVLFDVLNDAYFSLLFQVFLLKQHDLFVVSILIFLVFDVLFEKILGRFRFIDHPFDVVHPVK